MFIESHAATIDACRFCFMCRHVCTLGMVTSKESDTPRGKGLVLTRIVQRQSGWNADLAASLYRCCLCGMCRAWCVGGYDMPSAVLAARRDIVAQGLEPAPVQRIRANLDETGNVYGLPAAERFARIAQKRGGQADVVYYVGCDTAYFQPKIANAVIAVLRKSNAGFTLLEEETSTGKPLTNLGYAEAARTMAEGLAQRIRETGCKTLITACPASYDAFKSDFGTLLEGIEVVHATEYAARLIAAGRLGPARPFPAVVTLHDSDYLGRYNHLFDPPRQILGAIPRLELREMEWKRETALSCGESAGVFATLHPKESAGMAARLLDTARQTGGRMLATTCPVTKRTLVAADPAEIEVRDVMELLAESL